METLCVHHMMLMLLECAVVDDDLPIPILLHSMLCSCDVKLYRVIL